MNKPKDEETPRQNPVPFNGVKVYRDKLYTSRTLILPKTGRALPVLKGQLSVPASDAEAVAYLDASAEHELLKE